MVLIGGLLSSTFLTLLVVPAVYLLVDGLKRRVSKPSVDVLATPAAPAAPPATV